MERRRGEEVFLGLDLGGTKLLVREVDSSGNVLRSRCYPSAIAAGAGRTEVMASVLACTDEYLKKYLLEPGLDFRAVGMGMVGRVDSANGFWLEIQKPRMKTVDVVKILSGHYKIPCGIDNNVRSGVAAEQVFGKAKDCKNFIYMSIGTGIGTAFVINGKMLTGVHFCGGEVGHHVTGSKSGIQCVCGRVGCVKALASGMGLHDRAKASRGLYPYTALVFPESGRIDRRSVLELADRGGALCEVLAQDTAKAVAETISNLLWMVDPEKIIMGGGLITDGRLMEQVEKQISPMVARSLKERIEVTGLNSDYVGLIGAAAVGMRAATFGEGE